MEPIDRAALREKACAFWCGRCVTSPGTLESPCEMCGSVSGTVLALLDALDAAERKLDQARATLRAAANRARGIAQSAADDEAALAVLGPLVAELRALRAVRDAAEPAAVCHDRMRCFGLSGFPRDGYVCPGCRLRAALDAAKAGG